MLPNLQICDRANNESILWWNGLESFERNLAKEGRELYIIAGGRGSKADIISQDGFLINVPEKIWKVIVVLDKPGQTIANVGENTMAFAVELPNIDPGDDTDVQPTDWKDYVIPVRELEEGLQSQPFNDYDFLSNLPSKLQDVIEQRPRTEILNWINNNIATSSLLATPDTAVGHNSFIEDSPFESSDIESSSISQIGMAEIDIIKRGFSQISPSQINITEVGIPEVGLTELSINQNSTSQISTLQTSFSKSYSLHIGSSQIGKIQNSSLYESITKIGISENNITDIFERQTDFRQINSSEISFASSISSEQFFSSHNSTSEIINDLNNSATNIWSDLLRPETQLNINFQITDLPKGQLAEATITGFDLSGKPNAGTILIDRDANGVGWFIDETPLDNSEFINQNSNSYFLADPESAANGKYDLLTTVLHELAHLYGFIEGYAGFDNNVQTQNNTTQFIGDNFTAILDGEHLDKQAHPNDLLNTHLAPGIRKLSSQLNVEILKTILAFELEKIEKISETLDALLTSDPLLGIINGDFNIADKTSDKVANSNIFGMTFLFIAIAT